MKILVIDDHQIFREGLSYALQRLGKEVNIINANTIETAEVACQQNYNIDLVLLDLYLPGTKGLNGLITLHKNFPSLAIIMISASEDPQDVHDAIAQGALGFISKSSNTDTIVHAVQLVLSGEIYIPPHALNHQSAPKTPFTKRQKDVIDLVSEGCSNKIIARKLNISEATVKMHLSTIFRILGVSNRTQVLVKLQQMNLARIAHQEH